MILIADSGSTKCDWVLIERSGKQIDTFTSMGFNPYFHQQELIKSELLKIPQVLQYADAVEHVFFYGAGCSTQQLNQIITGGLNLVFTNAEVDVDHDLLGAAYSCYDGEPCISCILGTGSNSCFFDGEKLREEVPSLAYILGDEASGSYFGKRLIREYFYKKLPAEIAQAFDQEYHLSKDEFIRRIYKEPNANVYLASFMEFIVKHGNHEHVRNWIREGFREFIDIHVQCFPEYKQVKTHFVGSVSYLFRDILEEVCIDMNVELGRVIRKPIDKLVEYHVRFRLPQMEK